MSQFRISFQYLDIQPWLIRTLTWRTYFKIKFERNRFLLLNVFLSISTQLAHRRLQKIDHKRIARYMGSMWSPYPSLSLSSSIPTLFICSLCMKCMITISGRSTGVWYFESWSQCEISINLLWFCKKIMECSLIFC